MNTFASDGSFLEQMQRQQQQQKKGGAGGDDDVPVASGSEQEEEEGVAMTGSDSDGGRALDSSGEVVF